ncbi:peptidylprolyl isomerase [Candidatus Methylomirabilis limnetica]|nr:SurA N-terminal domain-containing protein [Candidatus Methylomirabilis limnetica]
MRGYKKALGITMWLVIFAFVGTTFLVWGFRSASGPGGQDTQNPIAAVEGEKIPYTEYQQAYQRQYRQYQEKLGDKFDEKILEQLNLKGQIVEALIGRRLLLHEAKRLGIVISPDELVAEITKMPVFSNATGFNRDQYLRTLQSASLTPERFEEGLREDLLIRKVEEWVKGGIHLLPDEEWEAFRFNRASVKAEYLLFSDSKTQQATIQKVAGLAKEKKSWEEIVKASGLKPLVSDFFSWDRDLPQVLDQQTFKETALALERGTISPIIQGTKASYILRVSDRKDPSPAEFEREKAQFSHGLLGRKRDQVFTDWIRQVRARAKVKIETASL